MTRSLFPQRALESARSDFRNAPSRTRNLRPARETEVVRRVGIDTTGMRRYQIQASRWIQARIRCLLADEQGLGKSIEFLRAVNPRGRTIVVCPNHLRLNWVDECKRWRPDLRPVLGWGYPRPGELRICHYEGLPEFEAGAAVLDAEHDWSLVRGAFDEAHYAKNPDALRTQKCELLARQLGRVNVLTGTPLLGKPDDLLGILKTFGLMESSYGDEAAFRKAFNMKRVKVSKVGPRVWKYGNPTAEARTLLAKVMLRRERWEVLKELPTWTEKIIRVEAPDDLREALDESLDAWNKWGDPDDLPPFELMSAAMRLLAEARIDAVREHVANVASESNPVIVFSAHRLPVLAMAGIPGALVMDPEVLDGDARFAMAKRFQEGEGTVLAGTIQAMGTGLTLTRAHHGVFVDETWTPGETDQARDRMVRIGQKNAVLIERFLTEHPLDKRRFEVLKKKRKLHRQVVAVEREKGT